MPDLMFVIDVDGRYVDFWADPGSDLAIPANEILGKSIHETGFAPKDLQRLQTCIRRALRTGKMQTYEYGLQTLGDFGYFEARIMRLNQREVISIVRDITDRKRWEEKLRQTSEALAKEEQTLKEKNIALAEILKHIDSERQAYRHDVAQEIARTVLPIIQRVKADARPPQAEQLQFVAGQLESILSRKVDPFRARYATLTPREMELCDLLREGLTSKEIAGRLNISLATVHKHREQIRRKLGFRNQRINLTTYLRLHEPPEHT
jgi:PAS domain S-box-containing protein